MKSIRLYPVSYTHLVEGHIRLGGSRGADGGGIRAVSYTHLRIIKAQKSRGAEFDEGSLMKRAKAYIPVLIPLFVIIFKRAERCV